jgi:hypothetical protein
MDKLEFQICLSAGKPKSRGKMKRHYRKLLKMGQKALDSLLLQLSELEADLKTGGLAPSRRELLTRVLKQIR